jgi:DNA modification methylase
MNPIILHERCALFQGDSGALGAVLGPDTVDAIVTDPPAGIGFMGKDWDKDKGGRDAWIAWLAETLAPAFAALKPGGHALVWAIPRTSHWTAMALERAGFEVRDVVHHLFGTGFPKSMNVAMAIDAKLGAKGSDGPMKRGGERLLRMAEGGERDGGGTWGDESGRRANTYVPGSPEAERWSGWGTALKPAAEHWILARKPIVGTVAANLMEHGTGALNVDACRIGYDDSGQPAPVFSGRKGEGEGQVYGASGAYQSNVSELGRWPAHVVLDEAAADELGDPRRYFYVTKAPRKEKDAGLAHLPIKSGGEATGRSDGSAGLSNPRAGAGRTGGSRNFHPTVKSIDLMRWLVRLVCPPGGTVLDPFAGSGTTGIAALAEGASFIGVEQSEEYIAITRGRLEHALKETAA